MSWPVYWMPVCYSHCLKLAALVVVLACVVALTNKRRWQ